VPALVDAANGSLMPLSYVKGKVPSSMK
jgi:hypothetical protein